MNITKYLFSACLFISCIAVLTNCKDDDDDTPVKTKEEVQLAALKKTWSLVSAKYQGTEDRTSSFENLKIAISGTYALNGVYDFSMSGSRPSVNPWPASGKWKFGSDPLSDLIRNPAPATPVENLPMKYTLANNQLTIRFTCVTCDFAGGRTGSISGEWEFVFNNPQ